MFDVEHSLHIVDFTDILKTVNDIISAEKLEAIARLYEQAFSNAQIEGRSKKYKEGYLNNGFEQLYLNLLSIKFTPTLYMTDPVVDAAVNFEYVNKMRRMEGLPRLKSLPPAVIFQ